MLQYHNDIGFSEGRIHEILYFLEIIPILIVSWFSTLEMCDSVTPFIKGTSIPYRYLIRYLSHADTQSSTGEEIEFSRLATEPSEMSSLTAFTKKSATD